ncbi:dapper homolog 2 [Sus scrofa]|uniref:Dishevelled binding antagonist of beta catenin 2 n=1 Tax=Sus scrofa TaxID=9823 RepID=A0A286ZMQ3_PIG|nr:dapper homolog 2 [Sus scrofa]
MWAPGGPPGPTGWDRRRVGARLRAALAGLHELQGLRARQQARVRGALAMQPPPGPAAPRGPRAQELRLEAALAALQEQLNHLRHQDVGLKTHLDQLDQQISELQLDVRRTSSEVPDTDSRPSSGFYELSDGGSCSLGTSCASVCSDLASCSLGTSCTSVCSDLTSCSLGTLLPATPKARPGAGDCRPRSADETTVCGVPLPAWGPQASEEDTGQLQHESRPRPVSTGDLERVLMAEVGLQKASAHPKAAPLLCRGMDPKFQCDLVSKGGREVYPFPSPLHAVALQSPLFAVNKETSQSDGLSPPRQPLPGPAGPSSIRTGLVLEAGPAGAYIDRLLRLRARRPPPQEAPPSPQELSGQRADREAGLEKLVCPQGRAEGRGAAQGGVAGRDSLEQPGPVPPWVLCAPVALWRRDLSPGAAASTGRLVQAAPGWGVAGPPLPAPGLSSRLWMAGWAKAAYRVSGWTGRAPLRPLDVVSPPTSLPTEQLPQGRQGAPPDKACEGQEGAQRQGAEVWEAATAVGRLRSPPAALRVWGLCLESPRAREVPGRSCSESSLYPVSFFVPLLVARRDGHQASAQALFPLDTAPLAASGAAGRKPRKWPSSVEISARAHPDPSPGPRRPAARRGGGPRPVCARARPKLPRQDARTRSESDGSECSAECASLFPSTVAESSEDEASDHTANRFGDAESSGSDVEGGAQSSRAAPPRAPASSRPPLPPVPRLCRVKASRALKKKIRRFQPATLKVMTMV